MKRRHCFCLKPDWIYIGCLIVLLITAASCNMFENDASTNIMWHEEDLSDYVIYAFGPGDSTLAVIDVASGEILKRISGYKGLRSVVADEDGSRLYISTGEGHAGANPGFIYEVNTSSWQSEILYEHAAHLLTNRRGGIYFITKQRSPSTGFAIPDRLFGKIDQSTGTVTELDSIYVDWGADNDDRLIEIHPSKPLVYAVDGNNRLYKYNYKSGEINFIFPELSFQPFARITLSGCGEFLYITGGPVLDLANEQIVGSVPVWRLGWGVSRRDGKEVYFTDPGGRFGSDPLSSLRVYIYDPSKNRIVDDFYSGSANRIQLTPKERYAIASHLFWYVILDLKTRSQIEVFVYSGENYQSIFHFYLAPRPPGL